MTKKYISIIMGFLITLGTAFAGTYVTTYSNGYCDNADAMYISTKFDKKICVDIQPRVEKEVEIVCNTMYTSTEKHSTCEKRGNCGCLKCENTYMTGGGGFVTTFRQTQQSRFRTDYTPTPYYMYSE